MMQTLIYVASALLILIGLILLWRDRRQSKQPLTRPESSGKEHVDVVVEAIAARRRQHEAVRAPTLDAAAEAPTATVLSPPATPDPGVAPSSAGGATSVTRATSRVGTSQASLIESVPSGAAGQLRAAIRRAEHDRAVDDRPEAERSADIERLWRDVADAVNAATQDVNDILREVELAIGPPGQPGWSFKNRGYGVFRRVLLAGASTAWLRLEVSQDGLLVATLRSHDDAQSFLNRREVTQAGGATAAASADLIAAAMHRAAEFAAHSRPKRQDIEEGAREEWAAVVELVTTAIAAANESLAAAKGQIAPPGAPAWDPDHRRFYILAPVLAGDTTLAHLGIARGANEIDCVLAPHADAPADLARRQLVPLAGLTAEGLATYIVGCVGPALAQALDRPIGKAQNEPTGA